MSGFDYASDRRWRKLRERVLRRDQYLCRECRRFGRITEATIVHHIWPVEDFPEYAFSAWNLISVCHGCHDKFHERLSRQLTADGLRWKNKTPPRPSG